MQTSRGLLLAAALLATCVQRGKQERRSDGGPSTATTPAHGMVVKGVLVDKAGKPLSGWHVQVVECDENGKHNLLGLKPELNEKGEQVSIDGTWIWLGASMGETDKTGLFGVSIPADYFAPGDKAHFVLRLAKELPPHENFSPIMDTKTGSVVVFTVPRSASSFDLTGRPLVVDAR